MGHYYKAIRKITKLLMRLSNQLCQALETIKVKLLQLLL